MNLLFVNWHVNPILLRMGSLEIRWYGLLFVAGFILGWYLFKWFFKREKLPLELLDSLLYTLLIATIVGARLGHCIFYQPDYYFGSWKGFLEIFMPWKGGLASHGGAIALLLAMWWYSSHYGKKNNFSFLTLEVRESNENARSLYSKFGFIKVGERKNYYSEPTENAILMTKYF